MKSVNLKINAQTGDFTLASPAAKADYGNIIQITDVPDSVAPAVVLEQASKCAFWAGTGTKPFSATIVQWETIKDKAQGTIIRY